MHDCCLAIEDNKKIKIVAIGQVYIPGEKIVVKNHFFDVSSENRRVSITDDVDPTALLPCPVMGFLFVCEAKDTFVPWPTNLIFPKKKLDKQVEDTEVTPSLQSPTSYTSSDTSSRKKYVIDEADRAKVSSGLLQVFMNKAMGMKKRDENIILTIPYSVFYNETEARLDYEEILDWCFQKEIGASHMSIFMRYLSKMCQKESVAGMYGFCDVNFLSPLTPAEEEASSDYLSNVFGCNGGKNINQLFFKPYHENKHWMLAVISPWKGMVFWLDPTEADDISEFAQKIIAAGVLNFSTIRRKDIKKMKKNPGIAWITPHETIESRGQVVPPKVTLGYDLCDK
ncbi:uncharacterized protein [Spinacia oleracea]|uniref:Ubiquitin-like protease family profile domain-containing protein n=1 Tax=Spinacia oleracea TaxID=3562 RepID=A0ABM3R817_SPIOL|nr:uncharacterized protein LOC130467299 [Spinacia oleracea]